MMKVKIVYVRFCVFDTFPLKRNYIEDIGETLHVEDIRNFDIDFISRCVSANLLHLT